MTITACGADTVEVLLLFVCPFRLGLYATMKKTGKGTSADVAAAAGLNERFVREWLHQQARFELGAGSHSLIGSDKDGHHWSLKKPTHLCANTFRG